MNVHSFIKHKRNFFTEWISWGITAKKREVWLITGHRGSFLLRAHSHLGRLPVPLFCFPIILYQQGRVQLRLENGLSQWTEGVLNCRVQNELNKKHDRVATARTSSVRETYCKNHVPFADPVTCL